MGVAGGAVAVAFMVATAMAAMDTHRVAEGELFTSVPLNVASAALFVHPSVLHHQSAGWLDQHHCNFVLQVSGTWSWPFLTLLETSIVGGMSSQSASGAACRGA